MGRVEVYAYTYDLGPATNATVVFQDPDGTERTTTIDGNGYASGEIVAGGMVWLRDPPILSPPRVTAYADVQPGSTLRFGRPPNARIATMSWTGQPPMTGEDIRVFTLCGGGTAQTLFIDDRCGASVATIDLLAVAYQVQPGPNDPIPTSYAYLPAQPVTDGGTVAIPSTAWRSLDAVSVQLVNLAGGTSEGVGVANAFGFSASAASGGKLPLVGPSLVVTASVARGLQADTVTAVVPLSASATLDFQTVAAPWVTQPDASGAWSVDDVGGLLSADAMATQYGWTVLVPGGEVGLNAFVISPPGPGGTTSFPKIPKAFVDSDPPPNSGPTTSFIDVVRLQTNSGLDPLHAAEVYAVDNASIAGRGLVSTDEIGASFAESQ
jgi:hypothetical protein